MSAAALPPAPQEAAVSTLLGSLPADDVVSNPADSLPTEVLEILLEHHLAGTVATEGEIADRLPVDAAAVAAAIDRIESDGTARREDDGSVPLTEVGIARATTVVRRHRLTERLLADVIGLEWWKVHHEAERWSGVVSADVESKLIDLLGDPGTCPHGNPIPGSRNVPDHPDAVRLADAPRGPVQVLRITETLEGDDEALQVLESCGFVPGKDGEVQRHERGWVQVAGARHDAALPPHVAAHTYVAPR